VTINWFIKSVNYNFGIMASNIYIFGSGHADGNINMKEILGGKGAGLAELSNIGVSVPNGFTVTTDVYKEFYESDEKLSDIIIQQIFTSIETLEQKTGKKLGGENPLLLSVRSGSRSSMPGMMDTILNLGLNEKTTKSLAKKTKNPRFASDCLRRFMQMYANVVLDIDSSEFERKLNFIKSNYDVQNDADLTPENLDELIKSYYEIYKQHGHQFPEDPKEQLISAIKAVFKSWMNGRAIKYREIYNIPQSWGTAVNIQEMVFGNFGDDSATGVCFSRDPASGENTLYGEFLVNAQGEDVVAGIRTPNQITEKSKEEIFSDKSSLENLMPRIFTELKEVAMKLEKHFGDIQDIEFTIEQNKLWILQARNAKRTPKAALRIAVEMQESSLITKEQAVSNIDTSTLDILLHPSLDKTDDLQVLTNGLPASPGAASGIAVFTPEDAENKGVTDNVILIRAETSPEDIAGMHASKGILTSNGGMTSHAAVVARGMGKACICGAGEVEVDEEKKCAKINGVIIKSGDFITIDGSDGNVYQGEVKTLAPALDDNFYKMIAYAKEIKDMGVRANADNPEDSQVALDFGAEGIGLCRTEHMFFAPERILAIRRMIFATNKAEREKALEVLLPYQKQDFIEIFTAMKGLPVTIRLLDPPLHEFLPNTESEFTNLAKQIGVSQEWVKFRNNELHEFNPMLGHRGCRLGITSPEIYDMQIRAILEAAAEVGEGAIVEIMVPLILDASELLIIKGRINEIAANIENCPKYKVGTMIELPRAALMAGEIAKEAEFFSFGTNDLTQTTMGISRDDASKFIRAYREAGIFKADPFAVLDTEGVGQLIEMACERGLESRSDLKIGLCGEHGGEPSSIEFCHAIGLDYVSCSPFRVPVAIIAAAQSAIKKSQKKSKAA